MPTLESYTLLFSAIALMRRLSYQDFERSRAMLDHLVERHPRSPAPKFWIGKWHVMRAAQAWSRDLAGEARQAQSWVQRGLDEQPDNAIGLAIDGLISAYLLRDLDTAGKRYEAALSANPNESLAWLFSSARHAYEDRGEEAARAATTALSLSPLDPLRYFYLSFAANAALSAGHLDDAIDLARQSIRANCTHSPTFRSLIIAQVLSDRLDEARANAQRLLALEPDFTLHAFMQRYPGNNARHAATHFAALRAAGVPEN